MKNQENITLEAVGEFPFTFYIEKAQASDEAEEMIIEGIASTTNIDHDNERFSEDALRAMEAAINEEGVPIRVEHQHEQDAIIGRMFKAWVDERNQLHVRGKLDKAHPVSPILHHSIKNGVKMGLSVGGLIKRATKEFSESTGGMVKTFYDVALKEVSVTPRPANYDAWLVAKSIAKDTKEAEQYSDNLGLRREFLFENSQLDYLQAFAKSVPDKAWRKVESPNNINKTDDTTMKEKTAEESADETTKAVSRAEFNMLNKSFKDLANMVSKGFESVGNILNKAMDGDAKDTTNPGKNKPGDESPTAKGMDSEAKDQANPGKGKGKDDTQQTAKAEDTEETTKAEDETETTKTSDETDEDKAKKTADDTYDMETVNRSIKSLNSLHKRLTGVKKAADETTDDAEKAADDTDETTKAEDEDETTKAEDETETTKAVHPLDLFVAKTTALMETLVDKMEKSGKRVMGFEKSFIDDLQNNPQVQAELTKLLRQPGFKKSVAMGVPYMVTKEGKRYPLQPVQEKVEKSQSEQPKDFRSMYKSRFSSVSNDTME